MNSRKIRERVHDGHSIVKTFRPDNRSFKDVNELMNWIIFGEHKQFYERAQEQNKELFV